MAEDTSSVQVIDEITVGLTRQNELTSLTEPGMASEWTLSDDMLTATFKIRTGIPWVKWDASKGEVAQVMGCDGTTPRTVTANDFAYGIKRTIDPKNSSPYAYVLGMSLKGAQDVIDGKDEKMEKLGVKVVDDSTLELTFNEPAVYNINIAGMWVAHAEPSWLIDGDDCTEGRGDRWTETGFNQNYGPWVLKEWVHDSTLTVTKNPFWPTDIETIPQAKMEEVTWTMLDDVAALSEYEAGNLEMTSVPLADMDRVKTDATLSKELNVGPDSCTYYLGFNTTAPVVDDVRVRRALSMAIDRQSLIDNVLKGEQQPAQWFGRPGILAGAPTLEKYPDLGVKFDVTKAKAVLQEYLDEKKLTADQLDITYMFNTSSGHQKIAETVQQMWKDNLGIQAKLVNQEWKVYLETTKSKDTPQVYRMGWCMDYPDANNFNREAVGFGGSQNPVENGKSSGGLFWKNDTYEQLVKDAAKELDPDKRMKMYADAENILVWEDAAMIPMYWYTRVTVTKPYVTRTYSVLGGNQRYEKWDIDMTAKP